MAVLYSLIFSVVPLFFLNYTISQVREVGNSSCFLLCRISEISQAIFFALCVTGRYDFFYFKKAVLILVLSARVHLRNPFFFPHPYGICDFSLLQGKQAGRTD